MYRNIFQGGDTFEVFNTTTKTVFGNWLIAKNVGKIYHKLGKTNVMSMRGDSSTQQMMAPKKQNESLGLVQNYLVAQILLDKDDRFCFEMTLAFKSGIRRRIKLLTQAREVQLTPLFVVIPLCLQDQKWTHLCIDVASIALTAWEEEHKSVDAIMIGGSGKIRQIYTVHDRLIKDSNSKIAGCEKRYMTQLPRQCRFIKEVPQAFLLIDLARVVRDPEATTGKANVASVAPKKGNIAPFTQFRSFVQPWRGSLPLQRPFGFQSGSPLSVNVARSTGKPVPKFKSPGMENIRNLAPWTSKPADRKTISIKVPMDSESPPKPFKMKLPMRSPKPRKIDASDRDLEYDSDADVQLDRGDTTKKKSGKRVRFQFPVTIIGSSDQGNTSDEVQEEYGSVDERSDLLKEIDEKLKQFTISAFDTDSQTTSVTNTEPGLPKKRSVEVWIPKPNYDFGNFIRARKILHKEAGDKYDADQESGAGENSSGDSDEENFPKD